MHEATLHPHLQHFEIRRIERKTIFVAYAERDIALMIAIDDIIDDKGNVLRQTQQKTVVPKDSVAKDQGFERLAQHQSRKICTFCRI